MWQTADQCLGRQTPSTPSCTGPAFSIHPSADPGGVMRDRLKPGTEGNGTMAEKQPGPSATISALADETEVCSCPRAPPTLLIPFNSAQN